MGPKGRLGFALAAIGLLAVAASAAPIVMDSGQDWSPIAASVGFGLAFVGLIIGGLDRTGGRR